MNTEVSLPAGTLCAERSAIARAATEFQKASSIVAIAKIDADDKTNPLWPCEVCESWLAKLRSQSPEIAVIAVASPSFNAFAVRVNGENQPVPRLPAHAPQHAGDSWPDLVILTEGCMEMPWEAQDLVYIDGAFSFLHSGHLSILREARTRGSHLLVGVHSDEVLRCEFDSPVLEPFEQRLERLLQNRHVSSVLKHAPWCLTADMLNSLGIKKVITGSVSKAKDCGMRKHDRDPYREARERGILEVVPSINDITEKGMHQAFRSS
jgi:cytidyltransferase-like protein